MTQTEAALTIAARLLAERDDSRTADAWRDHLMTEALAESQRSFEALVERLERDKRQP